MEWVADLQGCVVGLDTAPLIYFMEEHPDYLLLVAPFFEALDRGQFTVVTSIVTLLEVLVHPLRVRDNDLARQYREILLHARGLRTIPLSKEIAEESARLRAVHSVRTPDAIQLATAVQEGATVFLTNDARLPHLPTLEILVLDRMRPADR